MLQWDQRGEAGQAEGTACSRAQKHHWMFFHLMSPEASRHQMKNDSEHNLLCRCCCYPHLGLRRLRHRKVKQLAQSHTASEWGIWN